ncbi:hypothetical protein [Actinoplanes rectilineatus]|uniref:hypothetical protein n=1 Tax=Actinoplanes rectilineatus TaxID=113571 RepID=UPI0005F2D394|nr:hypothetical protein [Actinoplanes rectilineatus]
MKRAVLGALVPLAAVSGWVVMWVMEVWHRCWERRARARVLAAAQAETARHLRDLVPEQRESPESAVIPVQRRGEQ